DAAKRYLLNVQPGTECYDQAVDLAKQINSLQMEIATEQGDTTTIEEFVLQATPPATREEKVAAYKQVGHEYAQSESSEAPEEYDLEFIENY
ncbi:MAG: hypothetical protein L3J74_17405, partial [Bacteroidales bacterium]|nr:hypothetical protein [Bacteroidales bacterium]